VAVFNSYFTRLIPAFADCAKIPVYLALKFNSKIVQFFLFINLNSCLRDQEPLTLFFLSKSKHRGKFSLTLKMGQMKVIMKAFFIICFGCMLLTTFPVKAQEQVVPFTLTDRDRIARTEIKLEALETKMDIKFEAVNQRIDYIFWLLGIIVALVLFILGYTIWDRRTALKPALEKASLADEKSAVAITILRELAGKYPDIAEKLKIHGLL
jgi:hypothetical protein